MPSGGSINNQRRASDISVLKKNFIDNPIDKSKTNAISNAISNAENFTLDYLVKYDKLSDGNNLIFYTYRQQDNFTDIYVNYELGIKMYNSILCKETKLVSSVESIGNFASVSCIFNL